MIKIIIYIILVSNLLRPGIFGDTDEEIEKSKSNMLKLMLFGESRKLTNLNKENNYLKKILQKHKINYKYTIKKMKYEKEIPIVNNALVTTQEEKIYIKEQERKELLRLIKVNNIDINEFKKNEMKKKEIKIINYPKKNNEREKAKEELKKQMSF